MPHYAVYEAATGKVLQVGSSTNSAILDMIGKGEGEAVYQGQIDPKTTYLPGGVPTPKPEEPRLVTALEVKAHAGRLLSYTDWVVVKAVDTGEPPDPTIVAHRQAIRAASNALEAMNPIPINFTDPSYWP